MKVFRMKLMLKRLEREGRLHLVDDKCRKTMELIDGKQAIKNRFKALVMWEDEYYVNLDDDCIPVNINDCETL